MDSSASRSGVAASEWVDIPTQQGLGMVWVVHAQKKAICKNKQLVISTAEFSTDLRLGHF